jgi:hypothetical protein
MVTLTCEVVHGCLTPTLSAISCEKKTLTDLPRNQYESDWDWSNMSTQVLLYQGARDIKFN